MEEESQISEEKYASEALENGQKKEMAPTKRQFPKISNRMLLTVYVIIATVAIIGVGYSMWSNLPIVIESSDIDELPVTRNGATIIRVDSSWRKTTVTDNVESDVLHIPEASLFFSNDTSGNFICFFEDNEGNIAGDGVQFEIKAGKINGQDHLKIYCSKGFSHEADYRGYLYSKPPFWHIIIKKISGSDKTVQIAKLPLPPKQ